MEPRTTFADGLGERRQTTGTGNQPLDVLVLHEELTAVPSFEAAVRERVDQLAAFQHQAYVRIRGVGRLAKAPSRLAIASDHVNGVRLAELLTAAEKHLIPLEMTAALSLLRQIVPAVAALHEKTADVAHGALGPDRLVVTPDARVMIVEHVLGGALEQLRFSHERYWKELGIPLPIAGGLPRFDRRADVTQIGMVALALILGRPLGKDEYPTRIADIVEGVRAISANGLETLPPGVRAWLSAALQLDPRRSFATAVEAQAALEAIPHDETHGRDALAAFLEQCRQAMRPVDVPLSAPAPQPAAAVVPAPIPEPTQPVAEPTGPVAEPVQALEEDSDDDEEPSIETPRRFPLPSMRLAWVGAALVLIALASVGTYAGRRYFNAAAVGTLAIDTNPSGVAVSIDGEPRGKTPLTIELPAGPHTLEIHASSGVRTIPVTIADGAQLSQFIELPALRPRDGQLQVRTDPPGATVSVDGTRRGVSPITIDELSPGAHTVVLENSQTSVTHAVNVEAGATASLVVPMTAPQGVPVSGWIAVSAPVEVQIYENGQLLGSSRSERLMVTAGRHELQIVSEPLAYRVTRVVQVSPGRVSPVRVELPKGSMSFNALPWADVWLDGERLGETPIANVMVPIGEHQVVFRHPELGEQRQTVVVTLAAPARVSADLRKK